jgi:hypothetical protein
MGVVAVLNPREDSDLRVFDRINQLVVDPNFAGTDGDGRPTAREGGVASNIYDVTDEFIVRPNLPAEFNFLGTQRTPRALGAADGGVKANELPDGVNAQATRLNRIVAKVALKKPGIE